MSNAIFISRRLAAAVAAAAVALSPGLGLASPGKDAQVAGRTLTFLENGPSGAAVIGVVFDPSKPVSVQEKNAVMAALSGGYAAGGLTITAKPVEAGAVAGVTGVKALFVTHGVNYAAVGAAAKARHLIAIGSDPACVHSGACAVGVTTEPAVQIVVNRATAVAVGATFKAAFRMMITEL
jgi:hypothetical protein